MMDDHKVLKIKSNNNNNYEHLSHHRSITRSWSWVRFPSMYFIFLVFLLFVGGSLSSQLLEGNTANKVIAASRSQAEGLQQLQKKYTDRLTLVQLDVGNSASVKVMCNYTIQGYHSHHSTGCSCWSCQKTWPHWLPHQQCWYLSRQTRWASVRTYCCWSYWLGCVFAPVCAPISVLLIFCSAHQRISQKSWIQTLLACSVSSRSSCLW